MHRGDRLHGGHHRATRTPEVAGGSERGNVEAEAESSSWLGASRGPSLREESNVMKAVKRKSREEISVRHVLETLYDWGVIKSITSGQVRMPLTEQSVADLVRSLRVKLRKK